MRCVHTEIEMLQAVRTRAVIQHNFISWRIQEKVRQCIANSFPFGAVEGPVWLVLREKLGKKR